MPGTYEPPESGDLPQEGKRILRDVYQSCREKHPGEEHEKKALCAGSAWTAVKGAGFSQDEKGHWTKSESGVNVNNDSEQFVETSPMALAGKFIGPDGNALVKIISPGWGSSGFYSKEMLRRDSPKVYIPATHMHIDHPTGNEEKGRPERSLQTLAGVITEKARYLEDGPRGSGVYAEARVFSPFRNFLNEMAPFIGVSHRALGRAKAGEAEGKQGKIIESLDKCLSVDFVTLPGAGGSLVQMYESWTPEKDEAVTMEALETLFQEQGGCRLALTDLTDKSWGDLTGSEKDQIRGHFAYDDGGDTFGALHLPYKGADGAVKPDCVRAALAAIGGARTGSAMSVPASVKSKLEGILAKLNKESEMDPKDLTLKTLQEVRPDLIAAHKESVLAELKTFEADKGKDAEHQKALAENKALKEEVARLTEARILQEAAVLTGVELQKTQLPEVTKARILEKVPKTAKIKEGKLDTEALKGVLETTIKAESEYAQKISEAGKIRGFGGGTPEDKKVLQESFEATYLAQGMTAEKAKTMAAIAAAGR
jgi:hypothetical protein